MEVVAEGEVLRDFDYSVVLELDDKQLTRLLRDFGRIHQELQKHS
ncbi:hypothetical protein GQ600_17304 [Phytophthora cactorum]|nr:hypothetical protein GQ600_17304 [Phytophthora cactorum]